MVEKEYVRGTRVQVKKAMPVESVDKFFEDYNDIVAACQTGDYSKCGWLHDTAKRKTVAEQTQAIGAAVFARGMQQPVSEALRDATKWDSELGPLTAAACAAWGHVESKAKELLRMMAQLALSKVLQDPNGKDDEAIQSTLHMVTEQYKIPVTSDLGEFLKNELAGYTAKQSEKTGQSKKAAPEADAATPTPAKKTRFGAFPSTQTSGAAI